MSVIARKRELMTTRTKRLLDEVSDVCHECCERGCDYPGRGGFDCNCPTCPVSRLYDKLVGNDEEGESE